MRVRAATYHNYPLPDSASIERQIPGETLDHERGGVSRED